MLSRPLAGRGTFLNSVHKQYQLLNISVFRSFNSGFSHNICMHTGSTRTQVDSHRRDIQVPVHELICTPSRTEAHITCELVQYRCTGSCTRAHLHTRSHEHIARAHCIKLLWARPTQNSLGLAPYRRTQKHKAFGGSHGTYVQARSFAHVPAREHKHWVQSTGRRAPAHSIKPIWARTVQT